jgi:hypothetical protein
MQRNRNIVNTPVADGRKLNVTVETERCSNVREIHMDLKIKLLELFEGSHYLIVIAHGEIDREGLKQIFNEIEKTTRTLASCKVFIDLEEASLNVRPPAIHGIANQLQLHLKSDSIKLAVVASKFDRCGRLHLLRDLLCSQGLRVAVFDNTKNAAAWLSDGI